MGPWAELQANGGSELGRLGQAALAGFRATLAHGLATADPGDPARPVVERLLAQLADETDTALAPPPPLMPVSPPPLMPAPSAFSTDLARYDPAAAKLAPDDPALPKRLALIAWRLAPADADSWRERVRETFPGPLPGPDSTAVTDLLPGPLPTTPVAARMYPVVRDLLWFAANDATLSHMFRPVYRFGLATLTAAQRDRYRRALVERYEQVRDAEAAGDARALLLAWIDLDEAVHSLIHQPPAHPQSAFAQIARTGREALGDVRQAAMQAGLSFHVQCPTGRYADLKGLTDPDSDVPTDTGAAPGDVVLCTRLFLRLDGVASPGRVLYRTR